MVIANAYISQGLSNGKLSSVIEFGLRGTPVLCLKAQKVAVQLVPGATIVPAIIPHICQIYPHPFSAQETPKDYPSTDLIPLNSKGKGQNVPSPLLAKMSLRSS